MRQSANRYLERVYHPDRLLYPMRRVGPKGNGQFERISWDDAIVEVTSHWRDIIAQHGAQCILPYSYAGTLGLVNNSEPTAAFPKSLGAVQLGRKTSVALQPKKLSCLQGRTHCSNPANVASK